MNNKCDKDGNLLPDEQRLNDFGKLLRKSSLDELPQLFSVLVGNMSIIGPRPKTIEETCFIKDTNYVYRHCVRPGITGLAVIKGRNELDPDKAFRLDLEYVANNGFLMDFKIFIMTFLVVIFKKGVTSKNHVTFVPHYQFWKENGALSADKIEQLRFEARQISISQAKYVEGISKEQFEINRGTLIEKYKLRGVKHGKY